MKRSQAALDMKRSQAVNMISTNKQKEDALIQDMKRSQAVLDMKRSQMM